MNVLMLHPLTAQARISSCVWAVVFRFSVSLNDTRSRVSDTDLEWKVIYVGSAEDTRYDQVLEEVDVGPIPIGVNKFVLTAGS